MMIKKAAFFSVVIVFLISSLASAAPIDLPFDVRPEPDNGGVPEIEEEAEAETGSFISGVYDMLDERELDLAGAEADGVFIYGQWGWTLPMLDIYAGLGTTNDLEIKAPLHGSNVIFNPKDELFWQAGASFNLVEIKMEEMDLIFFADGKFRKVLASDEFDSVQVNGTTYTGSGITVSEDFDWSEWQGALGVAARIWSFVPYAGVKYSDVEAKTTVTAGGTQYALDAESDNIIGTFAGIMMIFGENFFADAEARFGDETGFAGKVGFKF